MTWTGVHIRPNAGKIFEVWRQTFSLGIYSDEMIASCTTREAAEAAVRLLK